MTRLRSSSDFPEARKVSFIFLETTRLDALGSSTAVMHSTWAVVEEEGSSLTTTWAMRPSCINKAASNLAESRENSGATDRMADERDCLRADIILLAYRFRGMSSVFWRYFRSVFVRMFECSQNGSVSSHGMEEPPTNTTHKHYHEHINYHQSIWRN